jgi:hypothetical protein
LLKISEIKSVLSECASPTKILIAQRNYLRSTIFVEDLWN